VTRAKLEERPLPGSILHEPRVPAAIISRTCIRGKLQLITSFGSSSTKRAWNERRPCGGRGSDVRQPFSADAETRRTPAAPTTDRHYYNGLRWLLDGISAAQ